jgi:hypothetical protein
MRYLANMRAQGVHHLICYCLNDSCRHQAIIDVLSYLGDAPVPWFRTKVKCAKCGGAWHERRRLTWYSLATSECVTE